MDELSIAQGMGIRLKSPHSGRLYVIICGSGGLCSRGPYPNLMLQIKLYNYIATVIGSSDIFYGQSKMAIWTKSTNIVAWILDLTDRFVVEEEKDILLIINNRVSIGG